MTPSKNLAQLLNLSYVCYNRALPMPSGARGDFQPEFNPDGSVQVTYCNMAMQYICNGMGYTEFTGMTANEMDAFVSDPHNGWISVDDTTAQAHANSGVIVLASKAMNEHGHVCLILPGILEKSLSYGKAVPKCLNVGKDVFYGKKVSFAFQYQDMPKYWALAGMIL